MGSPKFQFELEESACMSTVPEGLQYTRSHEWIRSLPDGRVEVGITDHAQSALGDLVFVDVPAPTRKLIEGEACAVVESVKAASDVYSPLDGEVSESNALLADTPELLNQDPYGAGWLMRVKPGNGVAPAGLMNAAAYEKFLQEQST
jgi:glycine cleavage system H protein